jgi:NTP pyrophosphatase (non-canonical NTP hydrolase)
MSNEFNGLNEYQERAGSTAIYPGKGTDAGVNYTILGLVGEAGELANKYKKVLRNNDFLSPSKRSELMDELGDVLWYTAALANELGFTLEQVARFNLCKLADRKTAGTLKNREPENEQDGTVKPFPVGGCIK